MKKIFTTTFSILFSICLLSGQVLFEEDFEGGAIPIGWTINSNATDGGWKVGSAASLSSGYFPIPTSGSNNIAATNDDRCNCNKSNEYFVTPAIDLSGQSAVILTFDSYFLANSYQNITEDATIEVSLDGQNWTILENLHGHGSWDNHTIDLSNFAGNDTVYIGFKYDDNGGFLYGFGIDNVLLRVPSELDIDLVVLDGKKYGEVERPQFIKATLFNGGITMIQSLEYSFNIDGETEMTDTLTNLNIAPFSYYNFESEAPWIPTAEGIFTVEMNIEMVNDQLDTDTTNNAASYASEIFPLVLVPDKMSDFLASSTPEIVEITGASSLLNKPTDLDFFPINGKDELWVINQRVESTGGSTVTISDATKGPTDFQHKIDGNAWHFMSLPTGIAFSDDNFNFGSSPGVKDANHNGGTFTGPSLWSSDLEIYAQPSGGNGSHLDMLHGSPYSMGIAHEKDNVFWIYDDWNKDIVRYDFVEDHGPGNDDHADAIVRRYKGIGIDADGNIPNHMIMDKASGWLYFVDNGNDRVMRLDINSGTSTLPLALINEQLAEHSRVIGFTSEVIIENGLERPSGIEIFENYLMVGNYANGDIVVYDMSKDFEMLGRIETGAEGLTGIKIGPDGNIWYTNRLSNGLFTASPGAVVGIEDQNSNIQFEVSPNPTKGFVTVEFPETMEYTNIKMHLTNSVGQVIQAWEQVNQNLELNLSHLTNGVYLLQIQGEAWQGTQKIVLNK